MAHGNVITSYSIHYTKLYDDPEKALIEFNNRWMGPMTADGLIQLAAHYRVARMMERDDFRKRRNNFV